LWIIPTEFTAALGSIAVGFGGGAAAAPVTGEAPLVERCALDLGPALVDPVEALAEARRQAQAASADATSAGRASGRRFDPNVEAGQHPTAPPVPPVPPTPAAPLA
jgi:hypothetical protein